MGIHTFHMFEPNSHELISFEEVFAEFFTLIRAPWLKDALNKKLLFKTKPIKIEQEEPKNCHKFVWNANDTKY